jgi:hypothetical protein
MAMRDEDTMSASRRLEQAIAGKGGLQGGIQDDLDIFEAGNQIALQGGQLHLREGLGARLPDDGELRTDQLLGERTAILPILADVAG